jgi:hypothetical protein
LSTPPRGCTSAHVEFQSEGEQTAALDLRDSAQHEDFCMLMADGWALLISALRRSGQNKKKITAATAGLHSSTDCTLVGTVRTISNCSGARAAAPRST